MGSTVTPALPDGGVRVRDMRPGDAPACEQVDADAFAAPVPRQVFAQLAEVWAGLCVVVTDDSGRVVGYAACAPPGPQGPARLVSLAVMVGWRRRGAGHALVGEVVRRLRASGAAEAELLVAPDDVAARRLYAAAGFSVAGRVADPFGDGEDRLRMRVRLQRPPSDAVAPPVRDAAAA